MLYSYFNVKESTDEEIVYPKQENSIVDNSYLNEVKTPNMYLHTEDSFGKLEKGKNL